MQNILQIAIQLKFFKNFSQWYLDVRVGITSECFNKILGHPFEFALILITQIICAFVDKILKFNFPN